MINDFHLLLRPLSTMFLVSAEHSANQIGQSSPDSASPDEEITQAPVTQAVVTASVVTFGLQLIVHSRAAVLCRGDTGAPRLYRTIADQYLTQRYEARGLRVAE
jgi:hypothetical protein